MRNGEVPLLCTSTPLRYCSHAPAISSKIRKAIPKEKTSRLSNAAPPDRPAQRGHCQGAQV